MNKRRDSSFRFSSLPTPPRPPPSPSSPPPSPSSPPPPPSRIMAHEPSGPCVVCGNQTTQRCSPCAECGLDLFLCGREHQKLLWFAHKRVCGVNANPFRFPPLTDEEVGEAIRTRHDLPQGGGSSITASLGVFLGVSSAHMLAFLRSLGHSQGHTLSSPDRAIALVVVRNGLVSVLQKEWRADVCAFTANPDRPIPPKLYESIRATASATYDCVPTTVPNPLHTPSVDYDDLRDFFANNFGLYTPFIHLLVAHTALWERYIRKRGWADEYLSPEDLSPLKILLCQSRLQLDTYVRSVASRDAQTASRMRFVMIGLPQLVKPGGATPKQFAPRGTFQSE